MNAQVSTAGHHFFISEGQISKYAKEASSIEFPTITFSSIFCYTFVPFLVRVIYTESFDSL